MKTYFIIALLVIATGLQAQSKRDSLFSGKIKNPYAGQAQPAKDSAAVAAKEATVETRDSAMTNNPVVTDKPQPAEGMEKPAEMAPDSLNRLFLAKQKTWKRFIESQTMIITQQADETRKVKKGEYYIEVDYEIGLNGRVKTNGITCSPHNDFLIQTVTDIMSRPPVLAPPIYTDGKPRTFTGKQQITILKK